MAKLFMFIGLMLLASPLANSARILDEVTLPIPLPDDTADPVPLPEVVAAPVVAPPAAALPSGQFRAISAVPTTNAVPIIPTEPTAPILAPIPPAPQPLTNPTTTTPSNGATIVAPVSDNPTTNAVPIIPIEPAAPFVAPIPATPQPLTNPTTATPSSGAAVVPPVSDNPTAGPQPVMTLAATTPPGGAAGDHPIWSFFMHDILGGSHPSGRVVTGIVANSDENNLPFSKPNNQIFPINSGVPLNTINNAINNNNYPFLAGLNGGGDQSTTLIQTNGNNVAATGNNQAFVRAGQLPQGLTLQQLMFGSVTVVDNEITAGHELGTAVLGRAKGFYITSSTDGTSHTVMITAAFHGGGGGEHRDGIADTVSFFGVHRTATPMSHIAIVGGSGKYENAKGYATIEAIPHEEQHTTDGLETITHFTLYLTP